MQNYRPFVCSTFTDHGQILKSLCFLSDLFHKKIIKVKIAFLYNVGGNHYAIESDSAIDFPLKMPKYTLTQLSIACF